jgi:hypothetical protein
VVEALELVHVAAQVEAPLDRDGGEFAGDVRLVRHPDARGLGRDEGAGASREVRVETEAVGHRGVAPVRDGEGDLEGVVAGQVEAQLGAVAEGRRGIFAIQDEGDRGRVLRLDAPGQLPPLAVNGVGSRRGVQGQAVLAAVSDEAAPVDATGEGDEREAGVRAWVVGTTVPRAEQVSAGVTVGEYRAAAVGVGD